MQTEEYSSSEFRTTIKSTFLLSSVLLLLGLLIAVFCPVSKEADVLEFDVAETDTPKNTALEIAYTASFITDSYSDTEFIPGVNSLYVNDYLQIQRSPSGDKGLDYYRNPQTRGSVEWFYLRVTGRRDVTQAILESADRENIPLTLAFALAYTESRFKKTAVNTNVNGSIDRGLFQLNDKSFPQLEDTDFFSPSVSARYGMRHLRYCRSVAKDDLLAVAMYNAGVSRVKNNQTPKSTLVYVSNIARYKANLDLEFEREVVSQFE